MKNFDGRRKEYQGRAGRPGGSVRRKGKNGFGGEKIRGGPRLEDDAVS